MVASNAAGGNWPFHCQHLVKLMTEMQTAHTDIRRLQATRARLIQPPGWEQPGSERPATDSPLTTSTLPSAGPGSWRRWARTPLATSDSRSMTRESTAKLPMASKQQTDNYSKELLQDETNKDVVKYLSLKYLGKRLPRATLQRSTPGRASRRRASNPSTSSPWRSPTYPPADASI